MPTVSLSADPVLAFYTSGGAPLVGGTLLTQVAGTAYPTYSDAAGTIPLPNPIVLNSRGEVATASGVSTPMYVVPSVAYTYTLSDALGNTIWTATNITAAATLNSILANLTQANLGAILFPLSGAEGLASVTPANFGYPWGDIRRYGAKMDGVTDDLTAISNAILVAFNGNGIVMVPGGTTFHSAAITMKPNVSLRGTGKYATTFLSSHGGDGIKTSSTINSVTGVFTEIRDCRFKNTNGSNIGGGLVDVGGTELVWRGIRVEGFKYGGILDQSELAEVELCDFENFLTGGVWLCNGADHTPFANQNYTNRISVTRCQFNGFAGGVATGVGIIDDGGVAHSFRDNNFNLCAYSIRIAGNSVAGSGTTATIEGSEFESATNQNIATATTSSVLGTTVGSIASLGISNNFFSPTASAGFQSMTIGAGSLSSLQVVGNRFISSAATIINTTNANTVFAWGNVDSNVGTIFDGVAGNHFENAVAKTSLVIKGNITTASALGLNGAAAPAILNGWGTPTGGGVANNFAGGTATLAQTSAVVAELIVALKAFGLFGT